MMRCGSECAVNSTFVFSGIVAYFFANEKLLPRGYIGAALMLLSLLVMEMDWRALFKKRAV